MDRLKFIWPAAIVVLVAFAIVIGIAIGFIDPQSLMI